MPKGYLFRNDDGDEIRVDFATMMGMQGGYLTIDGVDYRRIYEDGGGRKRDKKAQEFTKLVSDTLGFPQHQYEEFEADRQRHNFNGVEFRRDPEVPEFYQVHFSSPGAWKSYVKHRGYEDKNGSRMGVTMTEEDFRRAEEVAKRIAG